MFFQVVVTAGLLLRLVGLYSNIQLEMDELLNILHLKVVQFWVEPSNLKIVPGPSKGCQMVPLQGVN